LSNRQFSREGGEGGKNRMAKVVGLTQTLQQAADGCEEDEVVVAVQFLVSCDQRRCLAHLQTLTLEVMLKALEGLKVGNHRLPPAPPLLLHKALCSASVLRQVVWQLNSALRLPTVSASHRLELQPRLRAGGEGLCLGSLINAFPRGDIYINCCFQEEDPKMAAALESKLESMNCDLETISEEEVETEVQCSPIGIPVQSLQRKGMMGRGGAR